MKEIVLSAKNLDIGYQKWDQVSIIAKDISVSLQKGELVCLLGPNGIGKTTLLRTFCGLQPPLKGQIEINGKDLSEFDLKERAKFFSVVSTDRPDVGNLSAYSLVGIGRFPHTDFLGNLKENDHKLIKWALSSVGGEHLKDRRLNEMSDGEIQKVMVARALVQEPRLMILDEPTAHLDLPNRVEIIHLLHSLSIETETTILMTTHDLDLALKSADRIWLMRSDGMIQTGTPEDLILQGDFERAFGNEKFSFDPQTGNIQFKKDYWSNAQIIGDGNAVFWTKHALDRIGIEIITEKTEGAIIIHLSERDKRILWQIEIDRSKENCDSIDSLLGFIQRWRVKAKHD